MNIRNYISKAARKVGEFAGNKGLKALLAGTSAVASFTVQDARANIVTETYTTATTLVADGQTEYEVIVATDSTQHPSDQIVSSAWDVVVPPFITIISAELPDNLNNPSQEPNDYFFNYSMDSNPGDTWNRVDSSIDSSGELTENVRITALGSGGPSNRVGELGRYRFTVNTNAPLGEASFDLNEVRYYNSDFFQYKSPQAGVTIVNHPFNVISKQQDFNGCMQGPIVNYSLGDHCSMYDLDSDGDVDLVDFSEFTKQQ